MNNCVDDRSFTCGSAITTFGGAHSMPVNGNVVDLGAERVPRTVDLETSVSRKRRLGSGSPVASTERPWVTPRTKDQRTARKSKRQRHDGLQDEGAGLVGKSDGHVENEEDGDSAAESVISTEGGFVPPDNKVVMAPYVYLSSLPSKGIRENLITGLNTWLCVPQDRLLIIIKIVSMLHNMSLMLDDIEDESPLRRGHPSTHMIYGQAQTINSANYMFVEAFAELEKLSSSAARRIFISEVENLHCGQAYDLHWKYHVHCPSEDEYMMMVDNKTGGLFRLAVRMMQEQSQSPEVDLQNLINLLGRFFQIRDDYQNLMSDEYASQKGWCEDFDEGKISLPLIYTLSTLGAKKNEIVSLMRKRTGGTMPKEMKHFILREMQSTGALDRTATLLKTMQKELVTELEKLAGVFGRKNPMLEKVLEKLCV